MLWRARLSTLNMGWKENILGKEREDATNQVEILELENTLNKIKT